MTTIHLHNLIFHGYHGLYEGEDKTGNSFEVNLDVSYEVKKGGYDDIGNLINYVDLYNLVRKRMNTTTPLLEQLADGIMRKIAREFKQVREIRISIFKLNVPIENFEGKLGISMSMNFDK